ncbi:TPA: glycoside hydrolase family 19 protein [Stenotrophomonas maltophilia]|uniref:glycoside hydrolase family 19 protein n=1 Tax=Stenotrophomonas maltophilia TaxID=40324 RepID=UPI00209A8BBF|nr:glycoside hydrolase family 19 protein [Stenotrophomonas maltophilia]MCO7494925.1 glycoside hydrolase family 19 protein [Stenotrophomonas maltophilia]
MLTPTLLAKIMQCPQQRAQRWAEPINAAMKRFGINTPVRAAYFLAQLGHESLSLARTEESLSYSRERLLEVFGKYITGAEAAAFVHQPAKLGNRVYANRNGNGNEASGDGYLFRGRGPMQHTGRGNYRSMSQLIGQPLEEQPGLLIEPETGAMAAAAFWQVNGLNAYADQRDVLTVSRVINLGNARSRATPNGMADRTARTNRALAALGAR